MRYLLGLLLVSLFFATQARAVDDCVGSECRHHTDQITWVVIAVTGLHNSCVSKSSVVETTCTSGQSRIFSVPVGKKFCPLTMHAVVTNDLSAATEECFITPQWDMDRNGSYETEWHINGTSEGLQVGPNSGVETTGEVAGEAGNITDNICAPEGSLLQIKITNVNTGTLDCDDLGGVLGGIYGEYR